LLARAATYGVLVDVQGFAWIFDASLNGETNGQCRSSRDYVRYVASYLRTLLTPWLRPCVWQTNWHMMWLHGPAQLKAGQGGSPLRFVGMQP